MLFHHPSDSAHECVGAALQLSAQAELATDYFQLRYEDSLQTLLSSTLTAYQRTLRRKMR